MLLDVLQRQFVGLRSVAEDVHLTPYPSDDDCMSYIVTGRARSVVSLLDPHNAEDRPWIDREAPTRPWPPER